MQNLIQAAEQGDARAQHDLGNMYEAGRGVAQDFAEAKRWYGMAADQGDSSAQTNLGLMYVKGEGVPEDYVLAHMWWSLAASQGNETATNSLDIVADNMTPDQIAEAEKLAREWKPK